MDNYTRGFLREEDLVPSSSMTENVLRMFSPIRIANALAPVAHDQDGNYSLALPSAIADPIQSWKGMVDRHRAGIQDDEADARDAFSVAGSVGLGSVAATPLKPMNALGAMGRGIATHDLPMDVASRMARAKEMGFDTDKVVYHGTPDSRGIWENGFQTFEETYGKSDPKRVYFFADDPKVARTYADDRRAFDYQNAEPEVIPVHLKMENPAVIDWRGRKFRGREKNDEGYDIHDIINQARSAGNDSFIINNVIDTYNATGKPSTIRGVFDPTRIRSVEAAFDPAKSDSANLLAANPLFSAAIPLAIQANQNRSQPLRGGFGPRWETKNALAYQ